MPTACDPCPGNWKTTVIERLPAQESGTPREASAERGEKHEVPAAEASGRRRLGERHVDGRCAGVAVPLDVDEDPLHRQPHTLDGRLDDAQVRLMRDEEIHVVRGEAVALQ